MCETMERLQWSAFFKTQEPETYKEELLTLKRLQDSIAEKDADRSRELLEEFYYSSASTIKSFQKFKNEGCNLSKTFQYWDRFIALVAILRNLVEQIVKETGIFIFTQFSAFLPNLFSLIV